MCVVFIIEDGSRSYCTIILEVWAAERLLGAIPGAEEPAARKEGY